MDRRKDGRKDGQTDPFYRTLPAEAGGPTNQKLTNVFAGLKHCGDSHNYQTKSKTKELSL